MALRMPRPIAHASGVYHLNIRVPSDLVVKVKGAPVTLPIGGSSVTVRPSDKVIVSLRTRDPRVAKERFAEAEQALLRHWEAVRRGPVPLTHVQLVALAGDCYRANVKRYEDDPDYMPDGYLRASRDFAVDVACWRNDPADGLGDIGERDATVLACLARPCGPQLLAYELGRDIEEFGISVTFDAAVADLFGWEADALCRQRHIEIDPLTRMRLIREIARAYRLLDRKLFRNADGDYSPDENGSRFPPFVPLTVTATAPPPAPPRGGSIGVRKLFELWREARSASVAASTMRRYGPSIDSLDAFSKGKDVRHLTEDDVWSWAKHRLSEGCSARTVNRNDLVAVVSILNWATERDGGRLRPDNPATKVRLEEPKRRVIRERTFRSAEIAKILSAAKAVEITPTNPQTSASRRWCPWICAYSGARIQEVCHLSQDDIWLEDDVWVMRFPMTKDGFARGVPIHDHLVAEGLLDYWRTAGPGYLFVSRSPAKVGASRSRQEMRASEIASWIQAQVSLADGVSPNHGWRHTFATNAEAAGIPKRLSTAITGHNKRRDASDGYVTPSIAQLAREMNKYPRYRI